MRKLKVVLYITIKNLSTYYAVGGFVHQELEKELGETINFHPCNGYLAGKNLNDFLEACEDADLIITDAWSHSSNLESIENSTKLLSDTLKSIKKFLAPNAIIVSQLLDDDIETSVHEIGTPFMNWTDEVVMAALHEAKSKSTNK